MLLHLGYEVRLHTTNALCIHKIINLSYVDTLTLGLASMHYCIAIALLPSAIKVYGSVLVYLLC